MESLGANVDMLDSNIDLQLDISVGMELLDSGVGMELLDSDIGMESLDIEN